jgi:hypothetical protein
MYNFRLTLLLRIALGVWAVRWAQPHEKEFRKYCHQIAESLSQPSIMFKARLNSAPLPSHLQSRLSYPISPIPSPIPSP